MNRVTMLHLLHWIATHRAAFSLGAGLLSAVLLAVQAGWRRRRFLLMPTVAAPVRSLCTIR